jgi:hypothetical protein
VNDRRPLVSEAISIVRVIVLSGAFEGSDMSSEYALPSETRIVLLPSQRCEPPSMKLIV